MLRKILAAVLAAMMLLAFATSCDNKPKDNNSSKKPVSQVESNKGDQPDDEVSSSIAQVEDEDKHGYDYVIKTKSNFFRDTDEAKESVSKSETIKQYKNPGTYMIGAFQCHMRWMNAYGTDTLSRAKEFADVARSGYFNTYLMSADEQYYQYELPVIAETGGTFWLGMGSFNSKNDPDSKEFEEDVAKYTERVRKAIQVIKDMGYYELLNGFYWDEPIWNGQRNSDFLAQCKVHYVTFGLRNFPVFATGEFSDHEGNSDALGGIQADQMRKLSKEAAKYLTDVAYDSYGIDVRPEATYKQETLDRYEKVTGYIRPVKTGMDYYIAYKEWLLDYIGHPANFYYYPCAYETNVQGGITQKADEAYCTAHLEYMANDLLNDPRGGGLILYNFPTNGSSRNLDHFLIITDKNGYPTMHTETEKWETYSKALKNVCKKFSATKQTIQYK